MEKFLINISIFSLFFIYMKILPLDIETQPLIIMISILINLCKMKLNEKKLKKNKYLYIQIFIFVVFFSISIVKSDKITTKIIELFKYTFPLLSYLYFYNNIDKIDKKKIKYIYIIPYICMGIVVIRLSNIGILNNFINVFYSQFFPRALSYNDNIRGIAILAPEVSYFSSIVILYLILNEYLISKKIVRRDKKNKLLESAMVVSSIFTKSGYVYLILSIYYLIKLSFLSIKKVMIFSLLSISLISVLFSMNTEFVNKNRFFQVINSYKKSNNQKLSEKLIYGDGSSGARFFVNFLGYSVIKKEYTGVGMGEFEKNAVKLSKDLGFDLKRQQHFEYMKNKSKNKKYSIGIQTYFGKLIPEFGIFSIPLILFILETILQKKRTVNKMLKYQCVTYILITLIFIQGQMTNPIPWLFLAILNKKVRKDENSNRLQIS